MRDNSTLKTSSRFSCAFWKKPSESQQRRIENQALADIRKRIDKALAKLPQDRISCFNDYSDLKYPTYFKNYNEHLTAYKRCVTQLIDPSNQNDIGYKVKLNSYLKALRPYNRTLKGYISDDNRDRRLLKGITAALFFINAGMITLELLTAPGSLGATIFLLLLMDFILLAFPTSNFFAEKNVATRNLIKIDGLVTEYGDLREKVAVCNLNADSSDPSAEYQELAGGPAELEIDSSDANTPLLMIGGPK